MDTKRGKRAISPKARPGNRNAAKPPSERSDSFVQLRVRGSDKKRWLLAANGMPLKQWAVEILNKAAAASPHVCADPKNAGEGTMKDKTLIENLVHRWHQAKRPNTKEQRHSQLVSTLLSLPLTGQFYSGTGTLELNLGLSIPDLGGTVFDDALAQKFAIVG